jgi:hypothetical protein
MAERRILNPELGTLLREACGDRFKGDEGMERLAGLLSRRIGFEVSAASVRSYLNGHRTPPIPTAEALAEELDLSKVDQERVRDLVKGHMRRLRALRSENREVA